MSWYSTTVFYNQFSMLYKSGMPMERSFSSLRGRCGKPYADWIPKLEQAAADGADIADTLGQLGEKPLPLALFRAGLKSGFLPELCQEIVNFYEHAIRIRRLIITRSLYPLLLMHLALMIPAFVLWFTSKASFASIFVGPGILWAILIGLWFSQDFLRRSGVLARLGTLPVINSVVRPLVSANTCLVLHAGVTAGMMFPESLMLAASSCGNQTYGQRLLQAARDLQHERLPNLTAALEQVGLPPEVISLCKTGEDSGALDSALKRASDLERSRFEERVNWATRILMGLVLVIGMAMAIIAIFSMWGGYFDTIKEFSEL